MAYPVNSEPCHASKAILDQLQLVFWTRVKQHYPPVGENANICMRELSNTVDEVLISVNTWILDGHKVDRLESAEIEFPATPWEFWKQLHMPRWFVKRYPVKFRTTFVTKSIHQHYVCPHINMKDNKYPHIAWMYENSGQKDKK